MSENTIKAVQAFCRERIDDYDIRAAAAISLCDRYRIPIEQADYGLANDICECVQAYCEENDTDVDITEMDVLFS